MVGSVTDVDLYSDDIHC